MYAVWDIDRQPVGGCEEDSGSLLNGWGDMLDILTIVDQLERHSRHSFDRLRLILDTALTDSGLFVFKPSKNSASVHTFNVC